MNLKIILITSIFFLIMLVDCNRLKPSLNLTPDLKKYLHNYSIELSSLDTLKIKQISTNKGFGSLINWSDSLRNESFFKSLSSDCNELNIFDIVQNDSMICLSFGKPDAVVGATGGYLFLKIESDGIKIDEYRGGK